MKVALIVPYFGKLPNYFQLVLNSCEKNSEQYEWFFYTDDRSLYVYPNNCHVKYMSFYELKEKIQRGFDFDIALETPYKLCDFRPAYGYIFEEDIKKYDYWGHCDIDCIFGDLSSFITKDAFKADRVLRLGHLCMYKNTFENNRRFMLPIKSIYRYREVFSNKNNCIFDEHNYSGSIAIDNIWEEYGFSQFLNDRCIANIQYKSNDFKLVFQLEGHKYEHEPKKNAIFFYNCGHIFRVVNDNGNYKKEEFAYIHMMKRKMDIHFESDYDGPYKIIPNAFDAVCDIPRNIEKFSLERKKYMKNQYLITRYNNLKTKIKRKIGK